MALAYDGLAPGPLEPAFEAPFAPLGIDAAVVVAAVEAMLAALPWAQLGIEGLLGVGPGGQGTLDAH